MKQPHYAQVLGALDGLNEAIDRKQAARKQLLFDADKALGEAKREAKWCPLTLAAIHNAQLAVADALTLSEKGQ